MKNIALSPKKFLVSILQRLGLYKYAFKIKTTFDPVRRKYRGIKTFTATINSISVQFSTEDEYSNSWFFPRYAGGRIHERKVTEMLIDTLNRANCFVDVGTNLGWYTCLACKHMSHGTVFGFEMDDLNFELLTKNIAINKCSNVEVYNLAVSDSSGIVSYKRESNRPSPGFSLYLGAKDKTSGGFVSINSVTLDDFLEKKGLKPDVIKIDVEGAEMNVLKGMRRTLREFKPILFLEIHPYRLHSFKTSTFEILSLLIVNKYKVFEIEAMRSHESNKQLKPLHQRSILESNSMIYAEAAQ